MEEVFQSHPSSGKMYLGVYFGGRVVSWISNTGNLRIIVGNRLRIIVGNRFRVP